MSIDVFFVNKIPFLLTLSRKICFTTVTHLANQKADTIFAAFRSIFMYYLQKGFQIMTVTADNQFAPLAEMMYDLPGAPTLISRAQMNTSRTSRGGSVLLRREFVRLGIRCLLLLFLQKCLLTWFSLLSNFLTSSQ